MNTTIARRRTQGSYPLRVRRCAFNQIWYSSLTMITASEMGRRGAEATNRILTTEGRRRAAKKGWRKRKEYLKALKK